jgi:hypothetical protein
MRDEYAPIYAPIRESELLALYQDQLDNIRDLKANQLRISHYAIAGQVAYVATKELVEVSGLSTWVLAALAIATALGAVFVNNLFQQRIAKRREALDTLSKRPAESFDKVREGLRNERPSRPKEWRWSGELRVFVPLVVVQIIAAGLALWVIFAAA